MRWLLVALVFFSFTSLAYGDTHVITGDPGGNITAYIKKYSVWEANKDEVRIEGECDSACTLVLGIMDQTRVCATKNAELGFHSASELVGGRFEYSFIATQTLWFFYTLQERIPRVLARHGWPGPSKHPKIMVIDAQEIVRPCRD